MNQRGDLAPNAQYYYEVNIIWAAYLGMLLSIIAAVYSERRNFTSWLRILLQLFVFSLAVGYYYSLPNQFETKSFIVFSLLTLSLHLLIAFIPYTRKNEVNGFWQYNKDIFLRILMSILYSAVLYIGLSLALLAIDKLFKAEVNYKWYMNLYIFIISVFNTMIFLAGFPSEFENLESRTDYPKGLKIFTQYVLLPLISVYLLILYAYMLKIIFSAQWPYGWVSYLVLAFAIAGIFSLLLIYPISKQADNKWILVFSRFFYLSILPLIVLLFLAIERRIRDYGITVERFFVLALAGWLCLIALYFLISKQKNIKLIPVSLCLLALLSGFGSWGAFAVSLRSQSGRLEDYMQQNNLLKDGKFVPAQSRLKKGTGSEITSIVRYLITTHGYKALQPHFSQNLDSLMKADNGQYTGYSWEQTNRILGLMHIDESNESGYTKNIEFHSKDDDSLLNISGYSYLIPDFNGSVYDSSLLVYRLKGREVSALYDAHNGYLTLTSRCNDTLVFNVASLAKMLKTNYTEYYNSIGLDSLTLTKEDRCISAKCCFQSIRMELDKDSVLNYSIRARVLLAFKTE